MTRSWIFGLLVVLLSAQAAEAATLKIATVTPEGSEWMTELRASAKEIRERTDGRVDIKYYGRSEERRVGKECI